MSSLEGIQRKVNNKIKKANDNKRRLEKIGLIALLDNIMTDGLIETLKIMDFLIMVDIFSTFLYELEIYCQDRFQKTKSTYRLDAFFANRVKCF